MILVSREQCLQGSHGIGFDQWSDRLLQALRNYKGAAVQFAPQITPHGICLVDGQADRHQCHARREGKSESHA